MVEKITYVGRDLEAMSFAINYHRWILQIFKPYLGTRLVEVGAGTGSFTELLSKHNAESLSLIEPSEAMYKMLEERVEELNCQTPVQTYNTTFRGVADQLKVAQQPDSIIYVNVLEHISDDEDELAAVYRTLDNGGRIFIFVPALHWLFGSFDEQIGHYRRYTKTELESKCRGAGFNIIECKYFDSVGIVPWYIKYCLLRSNTMESQAVKLYDKYVVPALRVVESHVRPPIGKNVVLIAEKP
jgi:ubiquinone/menaquinone biosynthesis C-methylase UbiE